MFGAVVADVLVLGAGDGGFAGDAGACPHEGFRGDSVLRAIEDCEVVADEYSAQRGDVTVEIGCHVLARYPLLDGIAQPINLLGGDLKSFTHSYMLMQLGEGVNYYFNNTLPRRP